MRRRGRAKDLLWAAPLGICLIYAAAAYEDPAYGRQLLAAVGWPVTKPAATFGEASGEGRLMVEKGTEVEHVRFEPRHSYAYAYGRRHQRKILLILTAQPAELDWENGYAEDLIREWSKARQAPYVLVELDDRHEAYAVIQWAGDGKVERESLTLVGEHLRSPELVLEIGEPTRLKGRLRGGSGNCGKDYCDPRFDYTFDVSVLQ